MRLRRRTRAALHLALAAVACAIPRQAPAQGPTPPQPTIVGSVRLVLGERSSETFKVFVHSSGATLEGIAAHVALVQAKDGTARPSGWVVLGWPPGSLDSRGRYLDLTVDASAFGVGEFDVIVQFGWTGYEGAKAAPGFAHRTFTLSRPAAPPPKPIELPQDRLGERTYAVTRSWPWGSTSEQKVEEIVSAVPVPALSSTGERLRAKDTGLLEAALGVQPVPSGSPADPQRILLTIPALHHAGTFGATAHLSGPSLTQPARIAVTVKVGDAWGFPLVIIAIGVACAFAFSWFAGTWREREVFAMTQASLEADLAYWRVRATSTAAAEALATVADQVAAASRVAATGDLTAGRSALQKAADALSTFVNGQATRRRELWAVLEKLTADLADARAAGLASPDVDALANQIEAAAVQLRDRRADAAAPLVAAAETTRGRITIPSKPRQAPGAAGVAPPAPAAIQLRAIGSPDAFVAGQSIAFELVGRELAKDETIRWEVEGRWRAIRGGRRTRIRVAFPRPGTWRVTAFVLEGSLLDRSPVAAASATVAVLARSAESALWRGARRLLWSSFALSAFAVVVASVTGLLALWAGKPFGTPGDYLLSFLWGFGIDGTVRGFSGVLTRLREIPRS